MSDCKITCLPEEIITIILSYNVITMEDIINFRCVCKQFRYAAKYDKFLETKLSQRWPYAKKQYECLKEKEIGENMNFVTTGINFAIQLRNYLSQILFYDYYYNNRSNQNYFDDPIDNVLEFENNIKKHVKRRKTCTTRLPMRMYVYLPSDELIDELIELKYMFYVDEIKHVLTKFPRIDRKSIQKFCNIEKSHYKKLSSIGNDLDRYIEKSEREQLLEETCTFVAKYIQVRKDVCYTNVSASLDTIAQEVLNCLREKHPNHSIFSTSQETFSYWKTNNIENNHWDETESTQIMDTLQEYIFGTLNFRTCISSPEDVKWFCIDYVLQRKHGEDIIVYTIYHSVARRLGLRCDLIIVDGCTARNSYKVSNFACINPVLCIFWKPHYVTNNLENARCFYIQDKTFPNCLTDKLLEYTISRPLPIAITTEKMLVLTKSIVREFIMQHEIKVLRLIRVNCNV